MKFQTQQKRTVNRVKSVNPSIISKTKTKRSGVSLPLFTKKFDENDVFKIDIPEEMMIVGSFDPSLQGKFGQIKSMENGEAVFELLSKKGLETIVIPDFCLTKL
jgi:ribosomal protein L21E